LVAKAANVKNDLLVFQAESTADSGPGNCVGMESTAIHAVRKNLTAPSLKTPIPFEDIAAILRNWRDHVSSVEAPAVEAP
jgi:hypothetical protein